MVLEASLGVVLHHWVQSGTGGCDLEGIIGCGLVDVVMRESLGDVFSLTITSHS